MASTYDLTTSIGQMRMLIPDRPANGIYFTSEDNHLFTDEELTALLAMEDSVVKRGAALAIETVASDQVLLNKVIRLIDRATDGANASKALRDRAATLREQAEIEAQTGSGPGFDWAEMVVDDFSARERLENEALRNA